MRPGAHPTGVRLPLRFATGTGERFEEENSILWLTENVLPPIPAAHLADRRNVGASPLGAAWAQPLTR